MSDRKTKPRTKAKPKPRAPKRPVQPSPPPTTGSYFLSLELENVRCFSDRQTLDLSDGHGRPARWTILLGENGTGKTTILQMLAVGTISEPLSDGVVETARYRDFSRVYHSMRDSLIRGDGTQSSQWEFTIAEDVGPGNAPEEGSRGFLAVEIRPGESHSKWRSRPVQLPTCFAYSVERRLSHHPSLKPEARLDTAEGLFQETSSIGDSEGWLLRLDYASSKYPRLGEPARKRRELVKDVLLRILPDVSDLRFDASSGFFPTPSVQFKTPYGWVPLRQLGYGYRTMIAWVVDLAARMIERYPESPDPLAEPAVVLVDEIDLHLHPKWQRTVIAYLTDRFPNTQFIVTSHSPLIVQSAADANFALLRREGDHVVIENHPETIRGWRIDQVLTSDLFGLPTARPPGEEKLILRRDQLLAKSRLTAGDREELSQIEEKIALPTGESFDQARTMELIKDSIEYLKKVRGAES